MMPRLTYPKACLPAYTHTHAYVHARLHMRAHTRTHTLIYTSIKGKDWHIEMLKQWNARYNVEGIPQGGMVTFVILTTGYLENFT